MKFIAEGGTDVAPPPAKVAEPPAKEEHSAFTTTEADIPVSPLKAPMGPITLTLQGTLTTPIFKARFPQMHGTEPVGRTTSGNKGYFAIHEFFRRESGPSFQTFFSVTYNDLAGTITPKRGMEIPAMTSVLEKYGTQARTIKTGNAFLNVIEGSYVVMNGEIAYVYERMGFSGQRWWTLKAVCRNPCEAEANTFFNS